MGMPVEYKEQWDQWDHELLQRANDIIDLLLRAKRLGYRITTDKHQLHELVKLLEELGLTKTDRDFNAAMDDWDAHNARSATKQ